MSILNAYVYRYELEARDLAGFDVPSFSLYSNSFIAWASDFYGHNDMDIVRPYNQLLCCRVFGQTD